MRDIAKRDNEYGDNVWDASRSRHPTKVTKAKKKRVLEVVNKNPRLVFETSPALLMLGLVILWLIKFFAILVLVSRFQGRNHFGNLGKRKIILNLHRKDRDGIYKRRMVFIDEVRIEYNPCTAGKKLLVKRFVRRI